MESFAFGCKLPSRRPLEISAVITEGILAGSSGVEHLTAILLMYTYLLYYDMARGSLSGVGVMQHNGSGQNSGAGRCAHKFVICGR